MGGTNILHQWEGAQTFLHKGGGEEEVIGGYDEDNVYEEMYVSGASKLSAQARILWGLKGPEILA